MEFSALPKVLDELWELTIRTWLDAEMMSSKLQGQWMVWTSQLMAPKRGESHILQGPLLLISQGAADMIFITQKELIVAIIVLEIGTFTGFSALAWYEGTRATNAEIVTLDVRGEVLNFTRKYFKDLGVDDRITVVEGPAIST